MERRGGSGKVDKIFRFWCGIWVLTVAAWGIRRLYGLLQGRADYRYLV